MIIRRSRRDPSKTDSTDHTREYIPLIVYGKSIKPVNLGIRNGFSDIGAPALRLLRSRAARKRKKLFKGDDDMKEQELINAAKKAMEKSYAPYLILMLERPFTAETERFISARISKTHHFPFAAVPSATQFFAQLTTENGTLRPLPLWAEKIIK